MLIEYKHIILFVIAIVVYAFYLDLTTKKELNQEIFTDIVLKKDEINKSVVIFLNLIISIFLGYNLYKTIMWFIYNNITLAHFYNIQLIPCVLFAFLQYYLNPWFNFIAINVLQQYLNPIFFNVFKILIDLKLLVTLLIQCLKLFKSSINRLKYNVQYY